MKMLSALARILIVDDTPQNISLLNAALADAYTPVVATSGQQCIEICQSMKIDLILLDVMMPGMDGFETCRRLKENPVTRGIPVIFVTAKGDVKDEAMGFACGAIDYITKPISAPIVRARIKTHLALYDQTNTLEQMVKDRTAELIETRLEVMQTLGNAGEFRDNETALHVVRMSHFSQLIGRAYGLSECEAELLYNAASLHDVGKIGIPDSILFKPGKLNDDEWKIMHSHPGIGYKIIGNLRSQLMKTCAMIALTHHERWDGNGYPRRLKGEDIPLFGRIVAIADVFDALTSKRPYKEPWSIDDTIEEIKRNSGLHFDPQVVEAFLRALPEIEAVKIQFADDDVARAIPHTESAVINLMDNLKMAIRERHARMESLPFVAALSAGELPLESYVGQLRAMAVIHCTLEYELSQIPMTEVAAIYFARPSRLVHLRMDLTALDPLLVPDCLEAIEAARSIAEQIRRYRLEQSVDLLSIIYVLEGMTLGNAVHLPDIIKSFGKQVSGSTNYYNSYGDKTTDYWQELRSAMNNIPLNQAENERLVVVAHAFFDQLEVLFSALHPIKKAGIGFTATMLNPEAGQHSVPENATEIKAAVIAANRCNNEFPYFEERYQERGRSFAKSDAAWLATLIQLPQSKLMSQVEWLGRVLGNRGMPRITLERQLELLFEELTAALPDKINSCIGLLEAAGNLKSERNRRIPEETFAELARQFHVATNGELHGRLLKTGELIVSAVCDEAGGISAAVTSLLSWLTDKEHFNDEWISQVIKTTQLARQEVITFGKE